MINKMSKPGCSSTCYKSSSRHHDGYCFWQVLPDLGVLSKWVGTSPRKLWLIDSSSESWEIQSLGAVLGGSVVKNLPANAGDAGLIPGPGRSPGEGSGNPFQCSCLEDPQGQGGWWASLWCCRVGLELVTNTFSSSALPLNSCVTLDQWLDRSV